MKLERVSEFHAPEPLRGELRSLQQNMADALADVPSADRQQPTTQRRRVPVRATGRLIRPGDVVVCDSGTNLEIILSQPSGGEDGKEVMLIKQASGGTITLRAANSSINAAATLSVSAVGVTRIIVDGGNYWS